MPSSPLPLKRGPKWLRVWANTFQTWALAAQPVASPTCDIHETEIGRIILPLGSSTTGSGSSSSGSHRFEILNASTVAAEVSTPKLKVARDSWLMNSLRASDKRVIVGLDSAFTVEADQAIWLQVKFDGAGEEVDEVTIEHGDFGAAPWTSYPSPVVFDTSGESKRQTYAMRLLGYTQLYEPYTDQPTGNPSQFPDRLILLEGDINAPTKIQVVQCVTTNLLLCEMCFETDTVRVLADYSHVPAPAS